LELFLAVLGLFQVVLGPLWACFGLFKNFRLFNLGPFCSCFGVVLGCFGPFSVNSELFCSFAGRFGAVLSYLRTVLGFLGVVLGLFWAVLGHFSWLCQAIAGSFLAITSCFGVVSPHLGAI
jgi:hypothetical protein